MSPKHIITLLFLTLALALPASAADAAAAANANVGTVAANAKSLAEQADDAYNKKDFRQALALYRQAMDRDGVSSQLYYNMGNACYRLGDMGHAVLNYKRALQLDPSNSDARTNLEFVKSHLTDKPEDDSSFLGNVHKSIIAWFTPDVWAWVAFLLFVVTMSALALYMFAGNVKLRKAGFFGGFILLAVFVYALVVAWTAAAGTGSHGTAVVTVASTNLRSTPSSSNSKYDKVVPIHEGTELEIVDSLATPDDPTTPLWYDVKLNNTSRAWVAAVDVEKV